MVECVRISGGWGANVLALDASLPVDAPTAQLLRGWLAEHGLLVIPNQDLTKQQQVEFSRLFGTLAIHPIAHQVDDEVPELLVLDSHGKSGTIEPDNPEELTGKIEWHTDLAYVVKPNYAGVLHGKILPPEDGLTGFVDRQATYDALSDDMKARIEGLTVVQSWRHSQESISKNPAFRSDEGAKVMALDLFPDLGFPLVVVHPMTGRKILNVTRMWSSRIVELPDDEGAALLQQLINYSLEERFVYWHAYGPGDVVIWDNYRMMHTAGGTKGKYRRQMYRTTIEGDCELGGLPIDLEAIAGAQERIAALRAEMVGR